MHSGGRAEALATAPPREIRSLTGLRIVAALWVVAFHFSFAPGNTYTDLLAPLRPVLAAGGLGVDLFFVLSGFVITLTYLDQLGSRPSVRGATRFWWARVSRIWPVHALVTTIFGLWLLYKSTRVTDGQLAYQRVQPLLDLPHYAEQLLMVQLWHRPSYQGASFNGPAWSISAEWLAYCAFPVLALVLWRLRHAPAVVTGAVALACMTPLAWVSLTGGGTSFEYAWLLRIGGGFLAGAFTCLTVRRLTPSVRTDRIATRVAALAAAEIVVGLWWASARGEGQGGVVAMAFPVLVGALALSTAGLSRWLGTEPMVLGGRISFALYLVHIPVFEITYTLMAWYPGYVGPDTTLGSLALPHVLLLTLPLAWATYRWVEEPARKAMRSRGPGRWSVPSTPVPAEPVPSDETQRSLPPVGTLGRHGRPAPHRGAPPRPVGNVGRTQRQDASVAP